MMTETVRELTANVEVRRFNGQCEYGPWMALGEHGDDLPCWVATGVANQVAEDDAEEGGIVEEGGAQFRWRKA